MDTKICNKCQIEKDILDFSKNRKVCRQCRNLYFQELYLKNLESNRDYNKEYRKNHPEYFRNYELKYKSERFKQRKERISSNTIFINKLKDKPCLDCGKVLPPQAMEFDHIEDKKYTIANVKQSLSKNNILKEIEKCELVCSNCHRIRTLSRRNKSNKTLNSLSILKFDIIERIKEQPCKNCNTKYPKYCLEFDHRDPKDKLFQISIGAKDNSITEDVLISEINKCDLLCICCHRLKTFINKDFNRRS